jgi:hypothetical protein
VVTSLLSPMAPGQKVVSAVVAEEVATTRSTTVATSSPTVKLHPYQRLIRLDLQLDISKTLTLDNKVNSRGCIVDRRIAICRYHLTTTRDSKTAIRPIINFHLSIRLFQVACTTIRGLVRCLRCRLLTLLMSIHTLCSPWFRIKCEKSTFVSKISQLIIE